MKILFASFILSFAILSGCAQSSKTLSNKQFEEIICNTWHIGSFNERGLNKDSTGFLEVFPTEVEETIEFKKGGEVKFGITSGTWKYLRSDSAILITVKGKETKYAITDIKDYEVLIKQAHADSAQVVRLWRKS